MPISLAHRLLAGLSLPSITMHPSPLAEHTTTPATDTQPAANASAAPSPDTPASKKQKQSVRNSAAAPAHMQSPAHSCASALAAASGACASHVRKACTLHMLLLHTSLQL